MKINTSSLQSYQKTLIGMQFLFVAFGSTVLVPLLVGMDPSTALCTAGIGTLIFHSVTKGMVPIFLGSSFAFIAPIVKATEMYGLPGTMSGLVAVGAVYIFFSILVKWRGMEFISRLFPPVVIGPVIILIGLSLASSGVDMASENWVLALITLTTAILVTLMGKGLLKLIAILCGIIAGFMSAILFYGLDLSSVADAPWFGFPNFVTPSFSREAIVFLAPVAIAPVIEHIGDIYAINTVAGKEFTKNPGLHRTMLGDGLACICAGFIGGPPVTTYSEVTGAVSLTKITDPAVIRISAGIAILFSLLGKVSALLKCIPSAVLGGIMLLLFGTIASLGINNMVTHKTDLSDSRNLIIASLILTVGIGGAVLQWGSFSMAGIGLAALLGLLLNIILPKERSRTKSKEEKA